MTRFADAIHLLSHWIITAATRGMIRRLQPGVALNLELLAGLSSSSLPSSTMAKTGPENRAGEAAMWTDSDSGPPSPLRATPRRGLFPKNPQARPADDPTQERLLSPAPRFRFYRGDAHHGCPRC